MNTPLYLTAPIELRQPAEHDQGTFAGVAYSGGIIEDYYGDMPLVIDLAQTTVKPDMPLFASHDHGAVIGVVNNVEKGDALTVRGAFFADFDENAKAIAAKAGRGVKYQMSVGIFGAKASEIASGETETINGRELTGPVRVLRKGRVREVSVVPLGADGDTQAAFFHASSKETEANAMPNEPAELDELKRKVQSLTDALTAEKARADTAEAALDEYRLSARRAEIERLSADTGIKFDATERKQLEGIEEGVFEMMGRKLRDFRNSDLFHATLAGEKVKPQPPAALSLSASEIYAKRRVA
jgi:hypothetical protein